VICSYLAKNPKWGKLDLWADGVAPMLGVDLCVQVWACMRACVRARVRACV
jgi:hypothetical protein